MPEQLRSSPPTDPRSAAVGLSAEPDVTPVTAPRRLIQSGPRTAKLVIVGEAPGATEDRTGIPFSGAAGEALDRYLSGVGIERRACFVTNVVHARPPDNKLDPWLRPLHPIVQAGIRQLRQDLRDIRPNLALALGDLALHVLTRKQSITKYRGSILESTLVPGLKVLATYHPAAALRMQEYGALILFDMPRVAEETATPVICVPTRDIRVFPDGIGWVWPMCHAEWLSVDIETVRNDPHKAIICVGFSDRPERALVVPMREPGADLVIRALLTCGAKKCGQNFGQYDLPVLESHGYTVTNFSWDTLYSHHALLLEAAGGGDELKTARGKTRAPSPFQRGLAFQASLYTREPFWKDDGKEAEDTTEFYRYNGKDAAVTGEIRAVHERELATFGTRAVFDHEMALLPVLREVGERGIRIDGAARAAMRQQVEREIATLQASLGDVNVKSTPAIHQLLYETLQLPVKRHRETKRPTANKDALVELAAKHQHPVLLTILQLRKQRDLKERYLDVTLDADGRFRTLYDPAGTRSGRLASRQTIYGMGGNVHGVPPQLRRMFAADDGKMLVYADLSQAELRVVAYLARCEALIRPLDAGEDIHRANAIRFFGAYDEAKRVTVKRIVHGSNYGEGPDRIVQVAATDGVPLARAEVVAGQAQYFAIYPEIKERWWAETRQALFSTRTLVTPLGWRRIFYGRLDDKLFRDALAWVPQSVVGILGELALLRVAALPRVEVLASVHDAVLAQIPAGDVGTLIPAIRDAMAIPVEIHGRTLVIPADAKYGKNWGEADGTNTDGLRKWKP